MLEGTSGRARSPRELWGPQGTPGPCRSFGEPGSWRWKRGRVALGESRRKGQPHPSGAAVLGAGRQPSRSLRCPAARAGSLQSLPKGNCIL